MKANLCQGTQGLYDSPAAMLNLMENLTKGGFKAGFSFENGVLKLTIKKRKTEEQPSFVP